MKKGSLALSLNDVKVCKLYLLSSARDKCTAQILFPLQTPEISLIKGERKKRQGSLANSPPIHLPRKGIGPLLQITKSPRKRLHQQLEEFHTRDGEQKQRAETNT
jgi:hypothetical protein